MTPDDALRVLRAPDQRNMGRATDADAETGQVTADGLAALESCAYSIRAWNGQIVPGLLQTTPYAAGAIKTALPGLPGEEVQRRAYQRQERIEAFLDRWRDDVAGGCAWFILGEPCLTQPVINLHAHAAQLEHLLELSESRGRIQIQVMPDYQPTPGRTGQFSLYGLEASGQDSETGLRRPGPRVGYLETLVGGWYTTRPEDVARMYSAYSDMIGAALTPADSRSYIREALEWWSTGGGIGESPTGSRPTATQATASESRGSVAPSP